MKFHGQKLGETARFQVTFVPLPIFNVVRGRKADELPLRFLLNEDVRLPDDLAALAELVERERSVLVVVDSLYNALAPAVKRKDEEVAVVLAQLKAELCDLTGAGCALPWADRMWAT